jgi:hypothetical protein
MISGRLFTPEAFSPAGTGLQLGQPAGGQGRSGVYYQAHPGRISPATTDSTASTWINSRIDVTCFHEAAGCLDLHENASGSGNEIHATIDANGTGPFVPSGQAPDGSDFVFMSGNLPSTCRPESQTWSTCGGFQFGFLLGLQAYPGGNTYVDAQGPSSTVFINSRPNSGAGGLIVGSGGPSPSTALFIDGSGDETINGYLHTGGDFTSAGNGSIGGHLNQNAHGNWAGKCSMSGGTSCTFSLGTAYHSTPLCIVSPVAAASASVVAGACSVSGTTVTITAAASNSLTWNAVLIGNPN